MKEMGMIVMRSVTSMALQLLCAELQETIFFASGSPNNATTSLFDVEDWLDRIVKLRGSTGESLWIKAWAPVAVRPLRRVVILLVIV
jgi:hypothetical protein